MDKLQAVKTLKKTGKFTGGGGFEAKVVEENKRRRWSGRSSRSRG
jgi:hypothetical protein